MNTIDVHAHILSDETMGLLQKELPELGVKHTAIDADFGVLEVAGTAYGRSRAAASISRAGSRTWTTAEVDMQVVSNTPQTFLYGHDPQVIAASSRIQNDQIAKLVSERPDRFMGMATLPMQAPDLAAEELHARHAQARPGRLPDRLQHQRQEPRRSRARAVLEGRQ